VPGVAALRGRDQLAVVVDGVGRPSNKRWPPVSLTHDPSSFEIMSAFEGPEADIGVTCSGDVAVVTVIGELDLSNTALLCRCLQEAIDTDPDELILDISHLTYMDSSGLSFLVEAHNQMQAGGGTFVIFAPSSIVEKLLDVSGSVPYLTIHSDTEGTSSERPLVAPFQEAPTDKARN
jgi:anti-sigma B factor antagonist